MWWGLPPAPRRRGPGQRRCRRRRGCVRQARGPGRWACRSRRRPGGSRRSRGRGGRHGPPGRRGPEALHVAVARIGEPDGAVGGHDHVVRRVERRPVPITLTRLSALAPVAVDAADARGRGDRALFADDQPARAILGHPVRPVRVGPYRLDAFRLEWKAVAVERKPLDVDDRESWRRDARLARQGGEVEGVLLGDVHRALVRVDIDHPNKAWIAAENRAETRVVRDERRRDRSDSCARHDSCSHSA